MSYSSRVRRQRNPHTHEEGAKEGFFSKKHDTGADQRKTGFFQTKLTVNDPGDSYEKEADSVANDVVNKSSPTHVVQQKKISTVQRLSTPSEDEKLGTNDARMAKDKEIQEKPIQTKDDPKKKKKQGIQKKDEPMKEEDKKGIQKKDDPKKDEDEMKKTTPVQKKQDGTTTGAGTQLSSRIENSGGKGAALPQNTLHEMSSSFGADFSNVKIHQDSEAVNMNKELQAQAFTHGNDIYFNSGKYDPQSSQGKFLLAHELTHVVQQQQATPSGIQRFPTTTVSNVRSLTSEEYIATTVSGRWSHLRNKMADRLSLITARLALVSPGSPEHTTLTNLNSRWTSLQSLLSPTSGFDPARGTLPATIAVDIANETANEAALTGKSNRFVKAGITNFLAALSSMMDSRTTVAQEDTEMHRLDTTYNDPDVQTLVTAIPGTTFTTADVKAITGTETADLTNTRVHGISGTKTGIRTQRSNPGFLGLGQHSAASMAEAIAWASSNSVIIPATPDPRLTPATSIKLTAAYLGRVAEILQGSLPSVQPTGDEFKKMVFAGYNGGPTRVKDAAVSFLHGAVRVYTWSDIKSQARITGQMRNYVDANVTRLS